VKRLHQRRFPSTDRGLWSLLDVLELDAARFVTLCQALQGVRHGLLLRGIGSTVGTKEESTEPPWYMRAVLGIHPQYDASARRLQEVEKELRRARANNNAAVDSTLKVAVAGLGVILKELGLLFSLTELERMEEQLSKPGYVPDGNEIDNISGRIRDELDEHLFFQLNPLLIRFYECTDPLFGQDVSDKFPSLIYEIEEAGKCYALERSTASAFHSIRCLEGGIRALSRCLQIPDPTKAHERSWAKLLGTLKAAIDKKWPTSSDRLSGDGEFFENAYAALAAIQNPWRNATMHLDQKYTADEAKHIFDVVRGFMRKVASRCD
jgi:hypothetical protein